MGLLNNPFKKGRMLSRLNQQSFDMTGKNAAKLQSSLENSNTINLFSGLNTLH